MQGVQNAHGVARQKEILMTAASPTIEQVARATIHNSNHQWVIRLENVISRNAFYEASGTGRGAVIIRWGRMGSHGQSIRYSYHEAIIKLGKKLAGGYDYAGSARSADRQVAVRTIREAMAQTTMYPITQMGLLELSAKQQMSRMEYSEDYTDVFKKADRITLMRSLRGVVWVVVRYGNDLICGRLDLSY